MVTIQQVEEEKKAILGYLLSALSDKGVTGIDVDPDGDGTGSALFFTSDDTDVDYLIKVEAI
jgi:hypothetical protein